MAELWTRSALAHYVREQVTPLSYEQRPRRRSPPHYGERRREVRSSSSFSQKTRAYLATRPNRFVYVHTPNHGSWLNPVEILFSKMSRTFLEQIRVASWEELKERIKKGVTDINTDPIIHRLCKFDFKASQHETFIF